MIRTSITNSTAGVWDNLDYPNVGYSVRCIEDALPTGLENNNLKNVLKLFPNPTNDFVNVECSDEQNVKMQIYNIVGECLMISNLSNGLNKIDIHSLSKGIYIVKFFGTDWDTESKLIKE